AIFSVVDRLVLRPLPFKDADRMVEMTATSGKGAFLVSPSAALIDAWRRRSTLIEDVEYSMSSRGVLGDPAGIDVKHVRGSAVPATSCSPPCRAARPTRATRSENSSRE